MTTAPGPPFAAGSVSVRLYPHDELSAPMIVEELRAQAALAVEHGFDGVMTSEHHGGFHGYLSNPLQVARFCLDAMPYGWAAPAPPCSSDVRGWGSRHAPGSTISSTCIAAIRHR